MRIFRAGAGNEGSPSTAPQGFTLVELASVLAVAQVAVILVLPAMQRSREFARLSQCQNNLKQLALAMHNYHDVFVTFPPGYVNQLDGKPTTSQEYAEALQAEQVAGGWGTFLLPFVEQAPLYNTLDVGRTRLKTALTENHLGLRAMQTSLPTFRCTTDNPPPLNTEKMLRDATGIDRAVATSSYVLVNSSRRWHPTDTSTGAGAWITGPDQGTLNQWDETGPPKDRAPNGIAWRNSRVPLRSILDGTSNTLMIGERVWELKNDAGESFACGAGVVFGTNITNEQATVHYGLGSTAGPLNFNSPECNKGFSSQHPGGLLFTFVDGSVRLISEKIDQNNEFTGGTNAVDSLLERLASRNDGYVIEGFWD